MAKDNVNRIVDRVGRPYGWMTHFSQLINKDMGFSCQNFYSSEVSHSDTELSFNMVYVMTDSGGLKFRGGETSKFRVPTDKLEEFFTKLFTDRNFFNFFLSVVQTGGQYNYGVNVGDHLVSTGNIDYKTGYLVSVPNRELGEQVLELMEEGKKRNKRFIEIPLGKNRFFKLGIWNWNFLGGYENKDNYTVYDFKLDDGKYPATISFTSDPWEESVIDACAFINPQNLKFLRMLCRMNYTHININMYYKTIQYNYMKRYSYNPNKQYNQMY